MKFHRHLSVNVPETELMEPEEVCPVCGFHDNREALCVAQNNPKVSFLECKNCWAVSASRFPKESFLKWYYENYFEGKEKTSFRGKNFAKHLMPFFNDLKRQNRIRILDYGGGNGRLAIEIAKEFRKEGVSSVLVEVVDYQSGQDFSFDGIELVFKNRLEDSSGLPFDIALASAVLEHIPHVFNVIESIFEKIKPKGGFFYARTPEAVPIKRYLMPSLDLGYPAHLHDLGSRFWNNCPSMLKSKFEVISSMPSIVASQIKEQPLRTIMAILLKFPANVDSHFRPANKKGSIWKFTGGWEVIFKKR